MSNFVNTYHELERCIKCLVDANNGIYIPNIEPRGPVDYVFICMEPSLGNWARNKEEANTQIEAGFRNFLDGYNAMILHYSIRRFLCNRNQTYHITDFSKEAMLVKKAGSVRKENYGKWYPLLMKEIDLISSLNARVFAVGKHVAHALKNHNFPRTITPLIHYSANAVRHWDRVVREHKEAFADFQNTVTEEDFLSVAERVIDDSRVPNQIREKVLNKLKKGHLTLSRRKLMFNYRHAFDECSLKKSG